MKKLGYFQVIDYSLSHSRLLVRVDEIANGVNQNTDIIFDSTFYVEMPMSFRDIEIRQGTEEECNYVLSRCNPEFIDSVSSGELFAVTTSNKTYFVGAQRMSVQINNLSPLETSL